MKAKKHSQLIQKEKTMKKKLLLVSITFNILFLLLGGYVIHKKGDIAGKTGNLIKNGKVLISQNDLPTQYIKNSFFSGQSKV
jgi:hypothetical protein